MSVHAGTSRTQDGMDGFLINRELPGSPRGGGRFATRASLDGEVSLEWATGRPRIPLAMMSPEQRRHATERDWKIAAREHFGDKAERKKARQKPYATLALCARNTSQTTPSWHPLPDTPSVKESARHSRSVTPEPVHRPQPDAPSVKEPARKRRATVSAPKTAPKKKASVRPPKIGVRRFSPRKSIAARTTGRLTRSIKRALIPWYGKKGVGWLKNPRRAARNALYRRTTFGVSDLFR